MKDDTHHHHLAHDDHNAVFDTLGSALPSVFPALEMELTLPSVFTEPVADAVVRKMVNINHNI